MSNKQVHLTVCPGTLQEGFDTYSPLVLRTFFGGRKVSHVLQYMSPTQEDEAQLFRDNRKRISISGVQEKVSMLLDGNTLRLTREGERGTYLLKPIPRDLGRVDQVPANEHLTMQIAKQVFGLNTAQNALIFFKNGTPAYITKRFDVKADGTRWGKEDFASLAGKTEVNAGNNYKYDYSYDGIGHLIKKFVPAWPIEIERYFEIVLFNYLFSNGDAHLKNFALLETIDSDYRLSPFYDLINTGLHVDDSPFALSGGLFSMEQRSTDYQLTGYPCRADFVKFGSILGMREKRTLRILDRFENYNDPIDKIIERSFLEESVKPLYHDAFRRRLYRISDH